MQDKLQKQCFTDYLETQSPYYSNQRVTCASYDIQQSGGRNREKQALNQLRFLSEFADINESFGAWGDESMVQQEQQIPQNKTIKQKIDKGALSQKQKQFFKNTLNEMSTALYNLEKGNKKVTQPAINPKQRLGTQTSQGNTNGLLARQKTKMIEYDIDSADIINDLKKLRDDLQESPDRLVKTKEVDITSNIIYTQQCCLTQNDQRSQKQKTQLSINDDSLIQQNLNLNGLIPDDLSIQEYQPTHRSRSISTTTNSRGVRKNQQTTNSLFKSSENTFNTQGSALQLNSQFSNLLGNGTGNGGVFKSLNIPQVKYPTNGCNVGSTQIQLQSQDKGMLYYIIKQKSKDQSDTAVNKSKMTEQRNSNAGQQSTVGVLSTVSETAPVTPQSQSTCNNNKNQNFIISKKKGRQSFDLEFSKSKPNNPSISPVQNQIQNSLCGKSLINDQEFNEKKDERILNSHKRFSSQEYIKEENHNFIQKSGSQKKIEVQDTLKDHKIKNSSIKKTLPLSAREEKQFKREDQQKHHPQREGGITTTTITMAQEEIEETYNFECSSKFLLKKSISTSFQQNEELSKQNSQITIQNSASKRMSCLDISSHKQSQLLLIKDEAYSIKELSTQPTERISEHQEGKNNKLVSSEQIHNPHSSSIRISQQELAKIQFFERVKNKIQQSSTHRIPKSQYLNKNANVNQQNFVNVTVNQTPLISSSVTPKNKNINNQNTSFSRAIANNNKLVPQKEIQSYRGSSFQKQGSNHENLFIDNSLNMVVQMKSHSLPKKTQRYSDENNPCFGQEGNTKKVIKSSQNKNEMNKIPITQMLTNRISRESNLLMSNILKEKNMNESSQNLHQNENEQQLYQMEKQPYNSHVYKSTSINIKPINNNFIGNMEQNLELTPKNSQIPMKQSQISFTQGQFENRSNLLIQSSNVQRAAKFIRTIPKIPKPAAPSKNKNSETLLEINQQNVS